MTTSTIPTTCVTCGLTGQPLFDLSGEPQCYPCALDTLAFGHRHGHDEGPELMELEVLNGPGVLHLTCPACLEARARLEQHVVTTYHLPEEEVSQMDWETLHEILHHV